MGKGNLVKRKAILDRIQDQWNGGHPMDGWLLIIGGAFFALIIYFFIFIGNSTTSRIQYSSGDIVYTGSFQAVHGIGSPAPASLPLRPTSSRGYPPRMEISEQYYDFGTVDNSKVLERVFIIANRGQSPLIIQNAYTTCGCTAAEFTASEIPPGKVALIKLYFDTGFHDMRGTTVRRGVILQTNDPDQPQPEIWIQATVR